MLAMYIIVENKFWAGKNFFLTGILAVAKPCSIIVEVKELFGSESKSQVYAHLPTWTTAETNCEGYRWVLVVLNTCSI